MDSFVVPTPSFAVEPPTPWQGKSMDEQQSSPLLGEPSSPVPIATSSSRSSRHSSPGSSGTGSLSASAGGTSLRHHPYSAAGSLGSFLSERPSRPRRARTNTSASAASASEWSDFGEVENDDDASGNFCPVGQPNGTCDIDVLDSDDERRAGRAGSSASSSDKGKKTGKSGAGTDLKGQHSHARKTPPGHIKRPPNAFILFRSHCCRPITSADGTDPPGTPTAQQLAALNIVDHRNISRIVSHLWKGLAEQDRAYWENLARQKKAEHRRAHPDYVYKPIFKVKPEVKKKARPDPAEVELEKDLCAQVAAELLGGVSLRGGESQAKAPSGTTKRSKPPKSSRSSSTRKATTEAAVSASESQTSHVPSRPHTAQPQHMMSVGAPFAMPELSAISYDAGLGSRTWTLETVRKAINGASDLPPPPPPPPMPLPRPPRRRGRQTATQTAPSAHSDSASGGFFEGVQLPKLPEAEPEQNRQDVSQPYAQMDPSQFAFMAQLDEQLAQQQMQQQAQTQLPLPQQTHSLDPRHTISGAIEDARSRRPGTMSRSHSSNSSSRKAPPTPLELSVSTFSVTFNATVTQVVPIKSRENTPPRIEELDTDAPQSIALPQLARYSLECGNGPTPTASTARATSGGLGSDMVTPQPLSPTAARGHAFPPSPATSRFRRRESLVAQAPLAGMRRRGTIERISDALISPVSATDASDRSSASSGDSPVSGSTKLNATGLGAAGAGDLMLISPVAATFGSGFGRKFSLGQWALEAPTRARSSLSISTTVTPPDEPNAIGTGQTEAMEGLESTGLPVFDMDPQYMQLFSSQPMGNDFVDELETIASGAEAVCGTDVEPTGLAFAAHEFEAALASGAESDVSGRPSTAESSNGWSTEDTASRPGTSASERSIDGDGWDVARQEDAAAAHKYWSSNERFHVGQDDFFVPPGAAYAASTNYTFGTATLTAMSSSAPPAHPPINSSAFGGSFEPLAHARSIAAEPIQYTNPFTRAVVPPRQPSCTAACSSYVSSWASRRARGSDATIRARQDSVDNQFGYSVESEQAYHSFPGSSSMYMSAETHSLDTLQHQLDNPEREVELQSALERHGVGAGQTMKGQETDGVMYVYLTREQAKDAQLVDSFLRLGYGVSFDRRDMAAATTYGS